MGRRERMARRGFNAMVSEVLEQVIDPREINTLLHALEGGGLEEGDYQKHITLVDMLLDWVLEHGQPSHISLLLSGGIDIAKHRGMKFGYDFEYLATLEPTARLRELHIRFLFVDKRHHLPLSSIVLGLIGSPNRPDDANFIYTWVWCVSRQNYRLPHFTDALNFLVFIWDSRIATIIERAFSEGMVAPSVFIDTMSLVGALCVVDDDRPGCLRVWARMLDSISSIEVEPARMDLLESKRSTDPKQYKLVVNALQMIGSTKIAEPGGALWKQPHYCNRLTRRAVAASIPLVLSTQRRLVLILMLLDFCCYTDIRMTQGAVFLAKATFESGPYFGQIIDDHSIADIVSIIVQFNTYHAGHIGPCKRDLTAIQRMIFATIDPGELRHVSLSREDNKILLNAMLRVISFDGGVDEMTAMRIRTLTRKGAWPSTRENHRILRTIAKRVMESDPASP